MRIIDKMTDYYDYLQDPTDKLVFDRRGSFLLTKEIFCEKIRFIPYHSESKYRLTLLQCGANFWLFLVTITKWDNEYSPADYIIELLEKWKNYDKKRELLKFDLIDIYASYGFRSWTTRELDYGKIIARVQDIKSDVIHGNYKLINSIGNYTKVTSAKDGFVKENQYIPILKACGVGNLVEPLEMFCAIEEYFSLEKTASERTEAIGVTNDDKIIMHGFDTKTSFRGK